MLMERVRMLILTLAALGAVGSAGVLTYRGLAGEPQSSGEGQPALPAVPAAADQLPPAPAPPPVAAEEVDSSARYRTVNFVVTAPTRRCARLVADAAEQQRRLQARRWLGRELPDWTEPCLVHVSTPASLSGTLSGVDGSATSFRFDKGALLGLDMHLEGSLERILATHLPHEVTHTVFASYFGAPIPRWADEGGAMLAEDDEEQQRFELSVGEICGHPGRIIPLRRLLAMANYPKDVKALYAEGYSLTRFLVERKDRSTFLAFVKQGMKDGWDAAAQAQYGFRTVEDLEHAWLAGLPRPEAPRTTPRGAVPAGPGRFPTSPPPVVAFALMTDKGLFVRTRDTVYTPVREGERTAYQMQLTESLHRYQGADIRAFHPTGKRIDLKSLATLLPEETPVLVSSDGQKVDPFYLQLVKEKAVILVLPGHHPTQPIPPAPRVH